MRNIFMLLIVAMSILSGCASTRYGWMPAHEKTEEQATRDLAGCERDAVLIQNDKFGSKRDAYITNCMYAQGHKLVEIQ